METETDQPNSRSGLPPKRLPFGPKSRSSGPRKWPEPPPIPGKNAYYRQPLNYAYRGSIAGYMNNMLAWGFTAAGVMLSVCMMYFFEDKPRRFIKMTTGSSFKPTDEAETWAMSERVQQALGDYAPNIHPYHKSISAKEQRRMTSSYGHEVQGMQERWEHTADTVGFRDPDKFTD